MCRTAGANVAESWCANVSDSWCANVMDTADLESRNEAPVLPRPGSGSTTGAVTQCSLGQDRGSTGAVTVLRC